MRKPQTYFNSLFTEVDQFTHVLTVLFRRHVVAMPKGLHCWLDDIVNEVANAVTNLFMLGGKGEINHEGSSHWIQ